MTLYNNFIITAFIIFYLNTILSLRNPYLVIKKVGLDTVYPTATGLVFVVDVNNTGDDDFDVEMMGDKCCLSVGEEINCEMLEVIGTCAERVPRGTMKTMKLVAPILDPFERTGHCVFYLDSKSASRRKKTMRNKLRIDFDTGLQNKDQSMVLPRNVRKCNNIDEDPLNDCELVDCDSYYNGKKSYLDRKARKCIKVPECQSDSKVLAVYDPKSNKCMENMLKEKDIAFVKQMLEGKGRNPKDILIIKSVNNPNGQLSYDVFETNEVKKVKTAHTPVYTMLHKMNEKLNEDSKDMHKTNNDIKIKQESTNNDDNNKATLVATKLEPEPTLSFHCFHSIFNYCTVNALGIIVLIQCCCIFTMLCFLPKSCSECTKKKLVNKFFNYRQDASITTPLIATSNTDTETTHYTSESNIDKKIKCYKACQRDTDIKISLSDDILSKCITRRDWHSKQEKNIPQENKINRDIFKIQESPENKDDVKTEKNVEEQNLASPSYKPKVSETKMNFRAQLTESREREKKSVLYKSIIQKLETESDSEEKVPKCDSSEKEIQNHLYTEEKPSCDKEETVKSCEVHNAEAIHKDTFSTSTEKAAQAEFSNDSIDDFLSERGMIYLAGDDFSKYSLSSSSRLKQSSLSSGSSKASRNKFVKNVLSVFRRSSKTGPLSEPGNKKSALNMELLHMSHASLYSSSNNGSEYFKCLKRGKDSRTSL